MGVWVDQMMMFMYVFHLKVIGFSYGVACGLGREGCFIHMEWSAGYWKQDEFV